MRFPKQYLLIIGLLLLSGAGLFWLNAVPKERHGPAEQQDTLPYHRQYYLLQKSLSNPANQRDSLTIQVNKERWKMFPPHPGNRYVFVNIPDFSLTVFEHDSAIRTMKAIVGTPYRQTPVFSAKMTSIVFNPTWNIPSTILKEDILPLVLKDTSYLRKRHIRIYKFQKGERIEVAASEVNWKSISAAYFPYELIQDPGRDNALGTIKFLFPNPGNVYMHDTPAKALFRETERLFSSGCIRLSDAPWLAGYLLKGKWNSRKIAQVIRSGETTVVDLPEPIDVYIEYFTAWVDPFDTLRLRKDIYDRDSIGPLSP